MCYSLDMETIITLLIVLTYLLGLYRADKQHNSRQIEQYKQDTGCWLLEV